MFLTKNAHELGKDAPHPEADPRGADADSGVSCGLDCAESIAPGAIELIVIPSGASSMARSRVIILTPPLLMQYGAKCGKGSSS